MLVPSVPLSTIFNFSWSHGPHWDTFGKNKCFYFHLFFHSYISRRADFGRLGTGLSAYIHSAVIHRHSISLVRPLLLFPQVFLPHSSSPNLSHQLTQQTLRVLIKLCLSILFLCFVPGALCLCQVARVGGRLPQEHAGTLPFPNQRQLPSGIRKSWHAAEHSCAPTGITRRVAYLHYDEADAPVIASSGIDIGGKQPSCYFLPGGNGERCLLAAWHNQEGEAERQEF